MKFLPQSLIIINKTQVKLQMFTVNGYNKNDVNVMHVNKARRTVTSDVN